jgi:hypothetical protein
VRKVFDSGWQGQTAMVVSKLSCPRCKTVLRPAKPLPAGKKVKCPKCSADFTAEEGDADKPGAVKDLAEAAAAKKKAAKTGAKKAAAKTGAKKPDDDEEDSRGIYSIAAADRPKTQQDRDDEDDDEGNEINFIPDYSTKDLRGPAQRIVMKPSNMLIANGVIGFFGWIILFIILIIPVVFPDISGEDENAKDAQPKPALPLSADGLSTLYRQGPGGGGPGGPGGPGGQPNQPTVPAMPKEDNKLSLYKVYVWDLSTISYYPFWLFAIFLSPIFLGVAYACVMTYGAVQMQNLQSRTWGMVASCMCMFPYATFGFVIVCSMVISLIVYAVTDSAGSVLICLIAFVGLEFLGCIGIGLFGLMTLLRQEVIDGYEYVPDD